MIRFQLEEDKDEKYSYKDVNEAYEDTGIYN